MTFIKYLNAGGIDILNGNHELIYKKSACKMRLENPLISPTTGKLDQSQGLQTLGKCLYIKGAIS